ncbi:hypothetical protein CDL15_Pgr002664 [Punica granatum]|uniref:Uncharacterized protein n=1 Tax=Punica granatum TaxID=22663 RepID=A0A218W7G3_PUNGR|nr:hypothetical protein CDL15_Pgr002664 [Punica granatum]
MEKFAEKTSKYQHEQTRANERTNGHLQAWARAIDHRTSFGMHKRAGGCMYARQECKGSAGRTEMHGHERAKARVARGRAAFTRVGGFGTFFARNLG